MGEESLHAHTPRTYLGAEPTKVVDLATGKNIAVTVGATSFGEVRSKWGRAAQAGADLIEWRLDCLEESYRHDLAAVAELGIELREESGVPVLATWRTSREGGLLDVGATENSQQRFLGAEHYAELVLQAASWADGVDVELQLSNLWPGGDLIAAVQGVGCGKGCSEPRRQMGRTDAGSPVVVVSHHEFQVPPTGAAQLISLLQSMSQTGADVLKIAWQVEDAAQLDYVCQAQTWAREYLPHPTVLIAMGQAGATSRLGEVGAASAFTFATIGSAVECGASNECATSGETDVKESEDTGFSPARLGQLTIEEVRKSWLAVG